MFGDDFSGFREERKMSMSQTKSRSFSACVFPIYLFLALPPRILTSPHFSLFLSLAASHPATIIIAFPAHTHLLFCELGTALLFFTIKACATCPRASLCFFGCHGSRNCNEQSFKNITIHNYLHTRTLTHTLTHQNESKLCFIRALLSTLALNVQIHSF